MRYVDTAVTGESSSLQAWLEPRLAEAELLALRTGFFSVPGVQELAKPLTALLERGGQVEMVLGGDDLQADPQALWELLELIDGASGASVRVVTGPEVFHNAKTYYVRYPDQRAEAWVGSANLTRGGLQNNHEAGLELDSTQEPEATADVLAGIQHYRTEPNAEPLDAKVIRPLEARRVRQSTGQSPVLDGTRSLEDLLPTMDEIDAVASRTPGEEIGVPTGFADLNHVLNGLVPGTLTVVASQPGVGSSTLLLDFVRSSAIKHGLDTALFLTELPDIRITEKILSAEARIRLGDIRGGRMKDDARTRLARRMSEINEAPPPLLINTTPAPHLEDLTSEITALCAEQSMALVAIDSLSSITVPTENGASRERELALAARRLKTLARELDIPIVVTAELNRGPDHRTHKRPQLGDLRDSGVTAQVADTVILLHRPDFFERDDPRMGEADLILAKHRAGPTSIVTVAHQLHYSRFIDMAPE